MWGVQDEGEAPEEGAVDEEAGAVQEEVRAGGDIGALREEKIEAR